VVIASLQGLPAFLAYFFSAVALCAAYALIYTRLTAHDEFTLILKGNAAAALAFALSLLGFALPLASAIGHAASLVDCIVWGLVALVVQVLLYVVARLRMPDVSDRIAGGEFAAAIWLGGLSVTGGLLAAASMST
jgi:putative membrane protein